MRPNGTPMQSPVMVKAVALRARWVKSVPHPDEVLAQWREITGEVDSYPFPALAYPSPTAPWKPILSGEGEFPHEPMFDAVKMATEALAKLESGMLTLHEAAGVRPTEWDRPRAA